MISADETDWTTRSIAELVELIVIVFFSGGFAGHILRPLGRLPTLVQNVLPHLTSLRLLDLGQETGFGLTNWRITTIQSPLKYLRVSLADAAHLYHVISAEALSTTLEQLHVTLRSYHWMNENLSGKLELPSMMYLHTFTLIQSIFSEDRIEWSIIELLTAPKVMPVLRRMNLAIFITVNDLNRINGSPLFTDDRRIDVQFAFIVGDSSLGIQLSHKLPHGSRFYPREVVGVTCTVGSQCKKHNELPNLDCYVSIIMSYINFGLRSFRPKTKIFSSEIQSLSLFYLFHIEPRFRDENSSGRNSGLPL